MFSHGTLLSGLVELHVKPHPLLSVLAELHFQSCPPISALMLTTWRHMTAMSSLIEGRNTDVDIGCSVF